MPKNEEKKTISDAASKVETGPKVAVVTWFKTHEAVMNPGMDHITSYQQGNPNMQGNKKFFWTVGAPYVYSITPTGEMCIIPLVQFASFSVKL